LKRAEVPRTGIAIEALRVSSSLVCVQVVLCRGLNFEEASDPGVTANKCPFTR